MAAEAARLREAHLSAPVTPASSGWAVKAQALEGLMACPGAAQAAALGPFKSDGQGCRPKPLPPPPSRAGYVVREQKSAIANTEGWIWAQLYIPSRQQSQPPCMGGG